jgi:hypothetical protein
MTLRRSGVRLRFAQRLDDVRPGGIAAAMREVLGFERR